MCIVTVDIIKYFDNLKKIVPRAYREFPPSPEKLKRWRKREEIMVH